MIRCQHILVLFAVALSVLHIPTAGAQRDSLAPQLSAPIVVYNHGSNSDDGQLSAATASNENQALSDLDEIVRLKKSGMRIDYDLISSSSIAPGDFRDLRPKDWPDGPDAWISKCRDAGIRPGLEIGSNSLTAMQLSSASVPQWKDSLGRDGRSLSLFEGAYLPDLMSALQSWYDRGIRLFQFGPVDLTAATPATAAQLTSNEIVARNSAAMRDAFMAFHRKNRDALLVLLALPASDSGSSSPLSARNDSSGTTANSLGELGQLGAIQILPTGEPQVASASESNMERAIDIEDDGRVRRFEKMGLPLQNIDSAGFNAGNSEDTSLHELQRAWKGAFLLSMARGGWVNGVHGDLQQIRSIDALWMARAQKLFFTLQTEGRVRSFGGSPGSDQPYGFVAATKHGSVYVVVNPGLTAAPLALPSLEPSQFLLAERRIQFRDAGFTPRLRGDSVTLGPGQMAMIGAGAFAGPGFNFGVQQDVVIPNSIEPVDADFQPIAPATLEARINPPLEGVLRVVVHQDAQQNQARPKSDSTAMLDPGAGPAFSFEVTQSGRPIPVRFDGDEEAGSRSPGAGPLWLVAEIDVNDLTPGMPVRIQFHSNEKQPADLAGSAYQVVY